MSRIKKPGSRMASARFDEAGQAPGFERPLHRVGRHDEAAGGIEMGNRASSNGLTQISIPLSASDPNTAIIAAWLARHPADRSRAPLATGIQVEAALQRINETTTPMIRLHC